MYALSLSSLPEGKTALIKGINTQESMKRRLYDIGLIPGTSIECLQKSMFGDPTAFLIRGTVIAIRKKDSDKIFVKYI